MKTLLKRNTLCSGVGLTAIVLLAGCASQADKPQELVCEGPATYQVTFNSTWTSSTHPEDFPDQPHYSHLFGATHGADVTFWAPGQTATNGVRNIAETGLGLRFLKQVRRAILKDEALAYVEGNEMKLSPGTSVAEFELAGEHSRITLLNMLAPSPDWITGVSGLNLCANGQWLASETVSAKVYDGGTDDGPTYTAADAPREEREPIVLLSNSGRSSYGEFADVGTFEFKKLN